MNLLIAKDVFFPKSSEFCQTFMTRNLQETSKTLLFENLRIQKCLRKWITWFSINFRFWETWTFNFTCFLLVIISSSLKFLVNIKINMTRCLQKLDWTDFGRVFVLLFEKFSFTWWSIECKRSFGSHHHQSSVKLAQS